MTISGHPSSVVHVDCSSPEGRLSFYTDMNGLAREKCSRCGLDRFIQRRPPGEQDKPVRAHGMQRRGPRSPNKHKRWKHK